MRQSLKPNQRARLGKPMPRRSSLWIVYHILAGLVIVAFVLLLKAGEDSYLETRGSTVIDYDPYAILNVSRKADKSVIKKAHRELSVEWHPDKRPECGAPCHAKFKLINDAYRLLSDDRKRKQFDETQTETAANPSAFRNIKPYEFYLTTDVWRNIVEPSINGMPLWSAPSHVTAYWAVLVAEADSEWAHHLLNLWSDLAAKMYGRIAFLRVDAAQPETLGLLPLKPRLMPAIIMLSPYDTPRLYPRMRNFRVDHLIEWMTEGLASVFREGDDVLRALQTRDQHLRQPVVFASHRPPPSLLKGIAARTQTFIDWIFVDNPSSIAKAIEAVGKPSKGTIGMLLSKTEKGAFVNLPISKAAWLLDMSAWDEDGPKEMEDTIVGSPQELLVRLLMEYLNNIVTNSTIAGHHESMPFLCPLQTGSTRYLCIFRKQGHASLSQAEVDDILEDAREHLDMSTQEVDLEVDNLVVRHILIPPSKDHSLLSRMSADPVVIDPTLQKWRHVKKGAAWATLVPYRGQLYNYAGRIKLLPSIQGSWQEKAARWINLQKTPLISSFVTLLVSGYAFTLWRRRRS